jgi:pyrroloquinoline-quinone synthase
MGASAIRTRTARRGSDGIHNVAVSEAAVADFVGRLRAVGERRYHDKHPFHQRLVAGLLTREQVQAWVANRYYYQKIIPIKDAAVLEILPGSEYRRTWIKRILDHDGVEGGDPGGTEKWLVLGECVGLSREYMLSEAGVAAGTRFAGDAYVQFVRSHSWVEAVASSLTELFGPPVMQRRVAAILEKYPWIDRRGMAYFEQRIEIAPKDAQLALDWVCSGATRLEMQDKCVAALEFKCDVLWSILDATALACHVFHD